MKLTSVKEFDFKVVQEEGTQELNEMNGEFLILENNRVIGGLSVSRFQNQTYVSAKTPDTNFSIEEWISFMTKVKERFELSPSQPIMINKHPNSFAM